MPRTARGGLRAVAATSLLITTVVACGGFSSAEPGTTPGAIPYPPQARLDVSDGGDAGTTFLGFTSPQAPALALANYAGELARAGYRANGAHDGWYLFVGGGQALAVSVSQDGPPTDIVVRVLAPPSPSAATGTPRSTSASATGRPAASGKPHDTPPGQAAKATGTPAAPTTSPARPDPPHGNAGNGGGNGNGKGGGGSNGSAP